MTDTTDEEKEKTRRVIHAQSNLTIHPNEGESDEDAINRAGGEQNLAHTYEVIDSWDEPA